jgi:hypothetical protein
MDNNVEIKCKINEKFDSIYKLAYFLVDFNSICNFCHKLNEQSIEEAKLHEKKYSFGITSRYLNKNSLETIKLKEFNQGSLIALFFAPIVVGVLLKIIEKYINKDSSKPKIEVNINNYNIVNIINSNYSDNKSPESNFDEIITALKENDYMDQTSILYDQNGKRVLFKNIDRIKGQLIDQQW